MTYAASSLRRCGVVLAAIALASAPDVRSQRGAAPARAAAAALTGALKLDGSPVTVVAFYGRAPARLLGDAGYLEDLAGRFADHGVRVVAVASDVSAELSGVGLVEDPEGQLQSRWLGEVASSRRCLIAIRSDREVLFRGAPGCGVEDMLHRELAGAGDRDYEVRADKWRRQLVDSFDDLSGDDTVALLAPLAQASPRDGLLNGILYLTYAVKANDRGAARSLRERAARAMSDSPRSLAVFADLALRGDSLRAEVWSGLRPALEAASVRAPTDPFVQRALLRARVSDRDDRAAGRLAMQRRSLMTATANGCLDFAMMLARAEMPMIYRDVAEQAISRAAVLGAEPRLLAAARYVVRLRCAEDLPGAGRLLERYRAERGDYYRLNSDAWRFLTQVSTMGRYDWFAAGLVDELLRGPEALDYFEFDTAALAKFQVGQIADAVELQRAALREGGRAEAAYRDRLERYEAFAAPAPR